jgi:hypothetical protein
LSAPVLPPLGTDWKVWGRQLTAFLSRSLPKLNYKTSDDVPTENGVILWDEVNGYPVVAKGNVFREVSLVGGYANFEVDTDITAVSADTAYAIEFDTGSTKSGIAKDGTNATRLVIDEGGTFRVSFSAQAFATVGSGVTFYLWLRKNGSTVVDGSSMVGILTGSTDTTSLTRDCLVTVADGEYIELLWAVSSTSSRLEATAATAFSPASPSVTMTIDRIAG